MSAISGVAKKYDGTAIDYVSIFNWDDGKCIAQVIPNASGAWSYSYTKKMKVGIAYIADGCEPITHGAYDLVVSCKWWRITNILNRFPKLQGSANDYSIDVSELRFINSDDIDSNNPTRGFSLDSYPEYNIIAGNAFDDNPQSMAGSRNQTSAAKILKWYIGYEFDTPVAVTDVSVQARQDMQPNYGREWQTATVQYSDDGVTWFDYGAIEPRVAAMDLSLITTPIILI